MMRRVLLFILLLSINLSAQNISQLSAEKDNLMATIESNNKLLEEYSEKKTDELAQIQILDDLIAKRRQLILIYRTEIKSFSDQIKVLNVRLDSLQNEIDLLKEEYARIIYQESLNRDESSELLYILSAKSFNESYKRFLFLRQYNEYRRSQAERLQMNRDKFELIKLTIEKRRAQMNASLAQVKKEAASLDRQLVLRKERIGEYTSHESNLRKEIETAQARAKELENKILLLIQEEASKKRKNDEALSADILKNKGKLPWPSAKHIVTSEFGEHEHPLIESLIIRNNGIDINVFDATDVYPVQEGVVSRIIMIPGGNATVILRHGSVLTVYSNLSDVKVKKDEKVTRKTVIGKVFSDGGLNSSILHFEIWNGEEKQDPAEWLSSDY